MADENAFLCRKASGKDERGTSNRAPAPDSRC